MGKLVLNYDNKIIGHARDSVKVITNRNGDVITVIPKQWRDKIYIKYDEYEMLEVFNSEPISVGSIEEGELIYSYKDNQDFSVTLFMNVYAQAEALLDIIGNIEMGKLKDKFIV